MDTRRLGQAIIPAAIVVIVVMMVVPLPPSLLDLLIVVNISFAVLTLLSTLYVKRPLDFSVFPSLLLVATLFRLALNIATTRLILLHGFAGKVVESFGAFVVGGSVVVGLVIFLILIVIQFVVITNGASRVAEVAARFTLDAMPGKQMAIDADLNAGAISEDEARTRRAEISDEADFYGAMDGASKFVKGDAIAAIVIVVINLLGGLAIGLFQHGLSIGDAVERYSLLTVGDGLVTQISALLVSMSAGLIVTRNATEGDLGHDFVRQFTRHRRAVQMSGVAALMLALVPGIPRVPFLLVGGLTLLAASRIPADISELEAPDDPAEEVPDEPSPDSREALLGSMKVDPLEVELAYDLVDLVDAAHGGDLLNRVRALRRKLALDLGVVIPLVRTRDNLDLPAHTYSVRVHGVEVGRGEAPPGMLLAIGDGIDQLTGRATTEPVFGLQAKWIPVDAKGEAEFRGATVVDRASVVTTHLSEVARRHAGELLSRQDVKELVDVLKQTEPVVAEELTASGLTLGEVQTVLRGLLDEGVSVRDLGRICEVLSEQARTTRDPVSLVEACRVALGPSISAGHAQDGTVQVIGIEPMTEQSLLAGLVRGEDGTVAGLDPALVERFSDALGEAVRRAEALGHQPVLVCAAPLRVPLRRLGAAVAPDLAVLSYPELGSQLRIETVGVVDLDQLANV